MGQANYVLMKYVQASQHTVEILVRLLGIFPREGQSTNTKEGLCLHITALPRMIRMTPALLMSSPLSRNHRLVRTPSLMW